MQSNPKAVAYLTLLKVNFQGIWILGILYLPLNNKHLSASNYVDLKRVDVLGVNLVYKISW